MRFSAFLRALNAFSEGGAATPAEGLLLQLAGACAVVSGAKAAMLNTHARRCRGPENNTPETGEVRERNLRQSCRQADRLA
jgi:hypothetical protein